MVISSLALFLDLELLLRSCYIVLATTTSISILNRLSNAVVNSLNLSVDRLQFEVWTYL